MGLSMEEIKKGEPGKQPGPPHWQRGLREVGMWEWWTTHIPARNIGAGPQENHYLPPPKTIWVLGRT